MTRNIGSRREAILRIIVSEYIATAMPVASQSIYRDYDLGVSSATIRNDMAFLEDAGYIVRPHTSAGCVPLDKGYRYYVESLTEGGELSSAEQRRIRSVFSEAEDEFERWLKLAATLVSHLVGNAALVTFPKASQSRFRHLELVGVQEFLALLVLVMGEAMLKRQFLSFSEPVTQEQLTSLANKLNAHYVGLTSREILLKNLGLSDDEERVAEAVVDIMNSEDEVEYNEPYLEGVRLMLSQPEFAAKDRMLSIMELLEVRDWLSPLLSQRSGEEDIQVVIGEESRDESFKDLSLVFSHYGVPRRVGGTIGVIGPTRMDYRRVISTVGYVSEVLSDLVATVCHND